MPGGEGFDGVTLSALTFGKTVDAECRKTDRYGRLVYSSLVAGVGVLRGGKSWNCRRGSGGALPHGHGPLPEFL